MKFALGFALLLLSLLSGPASAQWVDWRQELTVDGLAGLDLGTNDSRTSRNAVLGVDGRTWILGRKDDPGEDDFFIARYGPDGERDFIHTMDFGGAANGGNLLASDDGGVYATAATTLAQGNVIHLLRFNPDGDLVWMRTLSPLQGEAVRLAALERADNRVYLAFPTFDPEPPFAQRFEVVETVDQGAGWQSGWHASYLVPGNAFDQVNLTIRGDGQRLAVSMMTTGSNFTPYLVQINTDTGGQASALLGSVTANRVLPPRFLADGSVRLAALTFPSEPGEYQEITLFRVAANGDLQGASSIPCEGFCLIDAMELDASGAAYVIGEDQLEDQPRQLHVVRFEPSGAPSWSRRYAINEASRGITAAAEDSGVVVGANAWDDENDFNNSRFVIGRLDEAGDPVAPGFATSDAGRFELIAIHRDASGTVHAAGADNTSIGRVMIAQFPAGASEASFLVDHGPAPTAVEISWPRHGLVLDQSQRPVVAFRTAFFNQRRAGLRAFDAAGALRWELITGPDSNEAEAAVAAVGSGDLLFASHVRGSGALGQILVRRIDAETGAATQPPQVYGESGIFAVRAHGRADGRGLVGASISAPEGVVIRRFNAAGVLQWRSVLEGDGFSFLSDIGFLDNGQPFAVFVDNESFSQSNTIIQIIDDASGSPGVRISQADAGQVSWVADVATHGNRVYATGYLWDTAQSFDNLSLLVLCADFDTGQPCWPAVTLPAISNGHGVMVDADSGRLYVAGSVRSAGIDQATLVAIDDDLGTVLWQRQIGLPGGHIGRDLFRRGDDIVMLSERLSAQTGRGDALVLTGFDSDGERRFERLLSSGARLEPRLARYHPESDRLSVQAFSSRLFNLVTETLLGIDMLTPDPVFRDRFQVE